ncbi:rod shape-determining protein MreD [Bryobacter aggregatus]|uniref:rod shape-determining protein MreD n=1 Tax=Bryobacter aggregatus TaxID=360054 RepID=UPI0004E2765B|nr:rod shape-determining protein MreD [Bryobacter aggregatus]
MASPEYSEANFVEGRRRKSSSSTFRPIVFFLVPLFSVLLDIFLPRFIESARALEFPLLVTIYFSLMKRQPIAGVIIGATIGLMQDSLAQQPLGMFGIVKTLVGYFAASVSLRFDVNNPALRFMLVAFFFGFHQFFYWVMVRALLGQVPSINVLDEVVKAILNSAIALPLFLLLDKLREDES